MFNKYLLRFKAQKENSLTILDDTKEKILFMTEKKKSLRLTFERIYVNFKNMAVHLQDIPMSQILNRMREAFDFDGKKSTQHEDKKVSNF